MASTLPIPPTGTPYIDPRSGSISEVWRRYELALQNAVQSSGAPTDATYFVSQSNAVLTNETNIGALATGYLKITTAIGVATPSTVTGIPAGDVTGTVSVAHGGTGAITLGAHGVVVGEGTSAVAVVGPDAATGKPLLSAGSGTDPAFGDLGVAHGGTGATTLAAHGVLLGNGTSGLAVAGPSATTFAPLLSAGSGSDPAFNAMTLTQTLTDGASVALNAGLVPWWVTGVFTLAAGGDRTISAPTNPTAGQKIVIAITASGGARTITLSGAAGGFAFGTDITGLTATTSGKTDYVGCLYNGSTWSVVAYSKGY